MVEPAATGNPVVPQRPAAQIDEGDSQAAARLEWTAQLVSNVDKKLRASVSVDELKKLCLQNALPEFKKVLQQFVCPICTNILEDYTACSECEALICRSCLNHWLSRDSTCPLCKCEFEEMKVSRQVENVLNMCEFQCPYQCGETFTYENRKRHFAACAECSEQQKCPFCQMNIARMPNGLTYHV